MCFVLTHFPIGESCLIVVFIKFPTAAVSILCGAFLPPTINFPCSAPAPTKCGKKTRILVQGRIRTRIIKRILTRVMKRILTKILKRILTRIIKRILTTTKEKIRKMTSNQDKLVPTSK